MHYRNLLFICSFFFTASSFAQGTYRECFREDGSGFLFKLVVDLSGSEPQVNELARHANQPNGKWSQTCWLQEIRNVSGGDPIVILGTWRCTSVFARTTVKIFADHVTTQRDGSRFTESYKCQ